MSVFGTSRHFTALRNFVAIGGIADTGQPNDPGDLWVHGLIHHAQAVEPGANFQVNK